LVRTAYAPVPGKHRRQHLAAKKHLRLMII
jgi:hypothetical protein